MKHFLDINHFTKIEIENLIERAFSLKHTPPAHQFQDVYQANLFYEKSTRTRVSFELAAKKLGISPLNIDIQNSSESKGETIEDTFNNLAAMGFHLFVIRHSVNQLPFQLAQLNKAPIINAGDGNNCHPSQALLDAMTILEAKEKVSELKIAIVGDVKHSRVANSLHCIFSKLGVQEVIFVAPSLWLPHGMRLQTTQLEEGLKDADVIICLRVQRERLKEEEALDLALYKKEYEITEEKLKYAKPDVIVMHPGPLNRGVEISNEVADGEHSCILQQVQNGVFARMSILESVLI